MTMLQIATFPAEETHEEIQRSDEENCIAVKHKHRFQVGCRHVHVFIYE